VAHTVDVDEMLDSMTPVQFDEWCAKDMVEPIGEEATRHVLALVGTAVLMALGCRDVDLTWFMPWVEKPKEQVITWATIMKQHR